MVELAQKKRIDQEFELNGKYYAFDSTTIDLCMTLFEWARFRSTKSGIKVHTQLDVVTQIPVSFNITEAAVHDVNAMDWIVYEPFACYILTVVTGIWTGCTVSRCSTRSSSYGKNEDRSLRWWTEKTFWRAQIITSEIIP